jgi:ribosome biogenesis GTPase
MTGIVIRGSRNIFTVRLDGTVSDIECRLKGKVLKTKLEYLNPLAPGDRVVIDRDKIDFAQGRITAVEDRKNILTRIKQKGQRPQVLACNIDLVLCVTSPEQPPFRPRFLDRALLQADIAGIPAVIVCNKSDLFNNDPDTECRLKDFQRLGYTVIRVSATIGTGISELYARIAGTCTVLLGQSGVGKSSLIKALSPDTDIRIGLLNQKYDRGNHTTVMAELLNITSDTQTHIIDTPGIRTLIPAGIAADELIHYMHDCAPLAGTCQYGLSCLHINDPGCSIIAAVKTGAIHPDRYTSFLRIRDDLAR